MAFIKHVIKLAQSCWEVRLVFDRYIKDSLKARTRKKRTSGKEVNYKVSDSTNISNISLKQLLSHIETKQELTVYLAKYLIDSLEFINKRYVVTYGQLSKSNIHDFTEDMTVHDHEEADTLIVLHCLDVARRDPFAECIVYSPDTDVFLLLIYHYELLSQVLTFRTGRRNKLRDIDIRSCNEALSPAHVKALLGFHTLTGCDQIGKFYGKSKTYWWKQFLESDNAILAALAELGKIKNISDFLGLKFQ